MDTDILQKNEERMVLKYKKRELLKKQKERVNDKLDWDTYENLIGVTEHIKYGCNFNDKGQCNPEFKPEWTKQSPQCCCRDCYSQLGYLEHINPKHVLTYIKLFKTKTGFWNEETGCVLDRKLRSKTCLAFSCDSKLRTRINQAFNDLINSGTAFPEELLKGI